MAGSRVSLEAEGSSDLQPLLWFLHKRQVRRGEQA